MRGRQSPKRAPTYFSYLCPALTVSIYNTPECPRLPLSFKNNVREKMVALIVTDRQARKIFFSLPAEFLDKSWIKVIQLTCCCFYKPVCPSAGPLRVLVTGDNFSFHFDPSYSSPVDPFNFSVGMIEPKSVLKLLQWWKESIVTVKFSGWKSWTAQCYLVFLANLTDLVRSWFLSFTSEGVNYLMKCTLSSKVGILNKPYLLNLICQIVQIWQNCLLWKTRTALLTEILPV